MANEVVLSDTGKTNFLEILKILQRYYEVAKPKLDGYAKRNVLLAYDVHRISITLRKLGKFEYQVFAWIEDDSLDLGTREQSWIHIDGISEERERLTDSGITDHPVFSINCISDIFDKEKEEVKEFAN